MTEYIIDTESGHVSERIIRCRDCRYYSERTFSGRRGPSACCEMSGDGYCRPFPDEYCSWGEPRGGGE